MRAAAWSVAAWVALPALAQDLPPEVSTEQRGGRYIEPPAHVDPAYVPPGPDGKATQRPEADDRLQLQLSFDFPLRSGGTASLGRGTQGSTAASPTLQAMVRWQLLPRSSWFAQATFYGYLRGDRQQAWNPDFSYAFGYDDPRPDTWLLVYGNYTGTRFHPAAGESRFNFPQGKWTLGRKFALPRALEPWFLVGDGDHALCSANGHLTPRYEDAASGTRKSGKLSLSLGCRYERPDGWFVEAEAYAYPDRSQQQPWDPDFTYGFGYDDPRPGSISVRYNNYSGNRFPGRDRGPGEGALRSGSVTITWKLDW